MTTLPQSPPLLSPMRQQAKTVLDRLAPFIPIRSNDGTDRYQTFTGLTQKRLEGDWKTRPAGQDGLTGCNSFVGWYALQLGLGGGLGQLDLQAAVIGLGKQHAWVTSGPGKAPEFGDILFHSIPHTDVAMEFVGKKLTRMAAGQGGRTRGYDVLDHVTGEYEYSYTRLRGWINIDKYNDPAPAAVLPAPWLLGWWSVWDGKQYYYYFGHGGGVQYVKTKPVSNAAPPKYPLNAGMYKVEPSGAVVIEWNPADGGATTETFGNARANCTKMNGTSNRYAPLLATKMP